MCRVTSSSSEPTMSRSPSAWTTDHSSSVSSRQVAPRLNAARFAVSLSSAMRACRKSARSGIGVLLRVVAGAGLRVVGEGGEDAAAAGGGHLGAGWLGGGYRGGGGGLGGGGGPGGGVVAGGGPGGG